MKWISAYDLNQWASSVAARTTFPGLIADLITASAPNITDFRFPNRETGQVRGFDGVLEATGAPPFVPDKASIWEFGLSDDVVGKADDDYEKRTKDVPERVRAETTFVFVTPRTWDRPSKQIPDWLSEKRALGQWKAVECFDGIALEHWLDRHPAVASYYARYELGLVPKSGAYSSQEFWDEFSTRYAPTLTEDVPLAGRAAQQTELLRRLAEGGSRLAFAADSADEVIAFVVAAIRKAPPETRAFLEARAMVVDSAEAARQLAPRRGLIFLPRGQARQFVGLLAQAGPTIVSAGADEQRGQHDVLARPTSTELARAFASMGIPEQEGYELARRCGRSLAVLARQRPSGTAEPPEWLGASTELVPALLAGAWVPSVSADTEVLKTLGGRATYEEVEAPLRSLTKLKDPPIDRVDDVWSMRSSVDAFLHLGHLIGPEHLTRFADQARAVFGEVIEPPKADETFQPAPHQRFSHSRWLREGMMTTLLHMAALHREARFVVTGSSPQGYVNDVIRGLPNLATDHRLLASLRDHLPLLAEAAPVPFLEALESLLEGNAEKIRPIFSEQDDVFAPASAHTGVLWALELLAWDEQHLLRAAMCLARLAAIDPGGKIGNRPLSSLRDILLAWSPHTNAPCQQRLGVLSHVVRDVPSIAWPLLVALLPKVHDIVSPTQKPRFAEASPGGREALTYGLVWATEAAIIELALQHVGLESGRWQTLIDALWGVQPTSFERVVTALDEALARQGVAERSATWDALRKEVNRYHAYSAVEAGTVDERLRRLDALVAKYQPDDVRLVAAWLFDDWLPPVEGMRDGDDPTVAIESARAAALKDVLAVQGIQGIAMLAAEVKLPLQMTQSLSRLALSNVELASLLRQLLNLSGEAKSLATVVVAQGVTSFGRPWLEHLQQLRRELHLSAEETAKLVLALEDVRPTWELVASLGADVDEAYWRLKSAFGFRGSLEELDYAIARYRACGRALAAIEVTHLRLKDVASKTLLNILESAISEINLMVGGAGTMLVYYLEHLFDELAGRGDIADEDLARMEFAYLPLLQRRRAPLALHRWLLASPEFFVWTICRVFRQEGGEASNVSEQERKLANAAYELLNGLTLLPGQVGEAVDYTALKAWTDEVRERASVADRAKITDARIGHLLAHAPSDPEDGAWPHRAVRRLLESLSSDAVERAVRMERFNMRGVYSKAIGEGGQQERALAEQSKEWARMTLATPRTAAMLMAIASMWTDEADAADARAAKDALRW